MLKSVKIEELYGNETALDMTMKDNLYILTGDNGAGKTTILNYLYYTLNGNFEWFFNQDFKLCKLNLLENSYSLEYILVEKGEKDRHSLMVHYKFSTESIKIKITNNNLFSSNKIKYEEFNEKDESNIKKVNKKSKIKYEINNNLQNFKWDEFVSDFSFDKGPNNINDLIKSNPTKYKFLNSLREAFIYFPTYRRIDIDLKEYIDSFTDDEFKNTNKSKPFIKENLNEDRRVIGVGNQGIESLYRNFSEALNKFNSDGMENLLNSHVKKVIQSVSLTKEEEEEGLNPRLERTAKNGVNFSLSYDNSAPESLIELANILNIDIQESEVNAYYNRKKEAFETLQKAQDIKETDSIKLFSAILDFSNEENTFVDELSKMYLSFKKRQNDFLIPYTFLEENIDIFFKGKISIQRKDNNEIYLKKGSEELKFSQLSTGEKQIITILSYTALAINNREFKPLILIDEPELSLHLRWQSLLLMQLSQKEDLTIFTATHSPYIARREFSKSVHQLGDVDE